MCTSQFCLQSFSVTISTHNMLLLIGLGQWGGSAHTTDSPGSFLWAPDSRGRGSGQTRQALCSLLTPGPGDPWHGESPPCWHQGYRCTSSFPWGIAESHSKHMVCDAWRGGDLLTLGPRWPSRAEHPTCREEGPLRCEPPSLGATPAVGCWDRHATDGRECTPLPQQSPCSPCSQGGSQIQETLSSRWVLSHAD